MKKTARSALPVLFLISLLFQGCDESISPESTGTLSIGLTDTACAEYRAVYVTIRQVQVHLGPDGEGYWQTISAPNKTYNLLDLVNGVMEQLALSTLEAGVYSRMRLVIGDDLQGGRNILGRDHPHANYVIDSSDRCHALNIPGGRGAAIELAHDFVILEGLTTELVLDFDVEKSVVRSAGSENWRLRPAIRIMGTLNKAIVNGSVTAGPGTPVAGARVSAQRYDPETRRVAVHAATLADDKGEYQMYLDPGMYSIVVYKDGYLPACSILMAGSNDDYEQSCRLVPVSMGTVSCSVTIPRGAREQVVEVHFLKASPLDEGSPIELRTLNVSQSGSYSVDLPAGAYLVTASNGAVTLPVQATATGGLVRLDFRV